ncbi:MAG: DUF4397 domain-containing protein [Balneolales bacterium]|nr:DUF4397 domain-containing protein [Balneolales bacterium]
MKHRILKTVCLAVLFPLLFSGIATAQNTDEQIEASDEIVEQVRQLLQQPETSLTGEERAFLRANQWVQAPLPSRSFIMPSAGLLMNGDPIFEESFETNELPEGWQLQDLTAPEVDGPVWVFDNPGNRDFIGGLFGEFFPIMDSQFIGSGNPQNTAIVTPAIDLSDVDGFVVIGYDEYYRARFNQQGFVEASTDGENWDLIVQHTTNVGNVGSILNPLFGEVSVMYDISDYAGESEVYIRWRFVGNNSFQWAFDNFKVFEPESLPIVALSTNSIDYGNTYPGGVYEGSFTIENVGFADLDASFFPADGNVTTNPSSLLLERLESESVSVFFEAQDVGSFSSSVAIETNAADETADITLSSTVNELFLSDFLFEDFNEEVIPDGFILQRFQLRPDGGIDDSPHIGQVLNAFFRNGSVLTNFIELGDDATFSFQMKLVEQNSLGDNTVPTPPEAFEAVVVATSDFAVTFDTLAVLNEVYEYNPEEDAVFQFYEVDLSEFAGETVQLGIRVRQIAGNPIVAIDDMAAFSAFSADEAEPVTLELDDEPAVIDVAGLFSGGVPPYDFTATVSDEDVVSVAFVEDGLEITPAGVGTATVMVDAEDALGNETSLSFEVTVTAEALVQIIHNAADPALESVDVYVNGGLALESFEFRTATPFIELPAGVELNIQITPAGADADAGVSFIRELTPNGRFTLVANGVLNPDDFVGGTEITVDLFAAAAQDGATEAGDVAINVFHGSTDAPAVDLGLEGVGKFVEDLSYGEFTGYAEVAEADYVLQLFVAGADEPLLNYELPLAALEADGLAITALASGFLDPEANQDGASFEIIAVLADGTVLTLENIVPTALVQVIHNAADPALESVDVYVNGTLAIESFEFRTATPFIELPAGMELNIQITPAGEDADAGVSFIRELTPDGRFTLIANGVLNPDDFAGGTEITVDLFADAAQDGASDADDVAINVFHGSTDAPAVDLGLEGVGKFAEDLSYGEFTGYAEVEAANYVLQLFVAGAESPLLNYDLPLAGLEAGGLAITALASGFLDPGANQDGAGFAIIAVLADGTVLTLENILEERFVTFSVNMSLESFEGNFDPELGDQLYVRGSFNDQGFAIVEENELQAVGGGIWEAELLITGDTGTEEEYKFYVLAGDDRNLPNDGWEGDVGPGDNGNRVLLLPGDDTELDTVFFNNREAESAMVQIIHNAADPAAAEVDIYVNGGIFLEDFAFREATPFVPLEPFVDYTIAIAPAGSESAEDAVFDVTLQLEPAINYTVVANGVLNPADFAPNPDGEETAFNLWVYAGSLMEAEDEDSFSFNVVHGATDAPAVDVFAQEVDAVLVADAVYGDITDYLNIPADSYTLEIRPAGMDEAVAGFLADVSMLGGSSATVLASGFLTPDANQDGEAFTLIVVLADGTVVELDAVDTSTGRGDELPVEFALGQNYPNPFNPTTNIEFALPEAVDVRLDVFNINGQRVATLVNGQQAAGTYNIQFDASRLASGMYIYRLQAGSFVTTRKMMLVK